MVIGSFTKVYNFVNLGLPELIRKELLKARAKEKLENKFGSLEDDGKRLHRGERLPIQENSEGNSCNENIYFDNTDTQRRREIGDKERRKMGSEIRPDTSSQEFLDKYFPSKVPIGEKEFLLYSMNDGERSIGYSRSRFHHSSLRDTVGLYHSILVLERSNGGMDKREYESLVKDLEGFLERINPQSHLIQPSTDSSKYENISSIKGLEKQIEFSKELK